MQQKRLNKYRAAFFFLFVFLLSPYSVAFVSLSLSVSV